MESVPTIDRIKRVIRESLRLGPDAQLGDDMSLLGGEYDLDSLDILLVVTNIEKEFGFKIDDKVIGRQAFASIATLSAFVDAQSR
ncbi:MAG: acyl carrier protein [Phycisphaerales bacterium]